jgi:hypothetical protein
LEEPVGFQLGQPIRTAEPGIKELKAASQSQKRISHPRGGKSDDCRPAAFACAIVQFKVKVSKAERVELAPPTDAMASLWPESGSDPVQGAERKNGVVRSGVEHRPSEGPVPMWPMDRDGHERTPAKE